MNINPKGNIVELKVIDPKHYSGSNKSKTASDDISTSFKDMFNSAVGKVNNLQVDSENLTKKMIYAPETVDIHQVMIAAQKAELSLTFTKTIRDEAISAYRDLINLR